ncbi:MAG: hypothetical protein KAI83_16025 [Thiomargarita sp.]|nr:hypothetical protein [Thiomargarita sp.]
MSNTNKKAIAKKALAGAVLLATSPAWAKGGGGNAAGKSQLGVNNLSLDVAPGHACAVCADKEDVMGKSSGNLTPNNLTIAIDPFETSYVELVFTVRDILAKDKNHVLFLVYSPQTSPSPQMPTPLSENKLGLDMSAMEILAIYNIPAQQMMVNGPTRLGAANPAPNSAVSFSVNLDASILPIFMQGNEKAYLQAAFMTKSNFEAGKYDTLILSEMDTLSFVKMTCPENHASVAVGTNEAGDGTMTTTDYDGKVGKTVTTSASAEATAETSTTITFGDGKGGM